VSLYAATADAYARRRAEDPRRSRELWLADEYLPGLDTIDRDRFRTPEELLEVLGEGELRTVPISHDCRDGFLSAYWRRPHAYLEPDVQQAVSSLALLNPAVRERGLRALARGLAAGSWAARHADLLERTELDLGHTLVIGRHT
jgi:hypothetical protein